MSRVMIKLAALLIIVYVALCALLFFYQRSLIYLPHPPAPGHAAASVRMPLNGTELQVSVRAHAGPQALLYLGGNAEDVSYSLPEFSAAFPDHALYLLHYRGYGGSAGSPAEATLVADAVALFDKIHAEHESVLVIGRSLGSGIAIQLASLRPVARLVLVTPYDSILEIAVAQFPYFPVRYLLLDTFESWKYADKIAAPTRIIAAEFDEVVPRRNTESLYAHFRNGVATLDVVRNTGHNTISGSPAYILLLQRP